jgi:hypothetical protein
LDHSPSELSTVLYTLSTTGSEEGILSEHGRGWNYLRIMCAAKGHALNGVANEKID